MSPLLPQDWKLEGDGGKQLAKLQWLKQLE